MRRCDKSGLRGKRLRVEVLLAGTTASEPLPVSPLVEADLWTQLSGACQRGNGSFCMIVLQLLILTKATIHIPQYRFRLPHYGLEKLTASWRLAPPIA